MLDYNYLLIRDVAPFSPPGVGILPDEVQPFLQAQLVKKTNLTNSADYGTNAKLLSMTHDLHVGPHSPCP